MSNILLVKNNIADGVIAANTIVKFSADAHVVQAAAVTDSLIGITTDIPAALNDRCDVIVHGLADVLYGGTVTRGDMLTTDASGRAVTAAPAAGVNNVVIGIAFVSGVVGDIGAVVLSQGKVQG